MANVSAPPVSPTCPICFSHPPPPISHPLLLLLLLLHGAPLPHPALGSSASRPSLLGSIDRLSYQQDSVPKGHPHQDSAPRGHLRQDPEHGGPHCSHSAPPVPLLRSEWSAAPQGPHRTLQPQRLRQRRGQSLAAPHHRFLLQAGRP